MAIVSLRAWAMLALLLVSTLLASRPAAAADSIAVLLTYHFRALTTPNTLGVLAGDVLTIGADVKPNPRVGDDGATGTTILATQGASTIGLPYNDSPAIPNFFGTSVPYNPDLTGSWALTVQNPGSTNSPVSATTPSVGTATSPGFITGFSMAGAGATPTFNWHLPNLSHNDQTLFISRRLPAGQVQIIHLVNLPAIATSYTVPSTLSGGGSLEVGQHYWANINLNTLRQSPPPGHSSLLSRSRSIFEFLVQTSPPTNPIFLPFTSSDGVFRFHIPGVGATEIFIDPPVAIGYDYAIGPGDPNFASVRLPDIGDGTYELYLWNGTAWVFDRLVTAGVQHVFAAGGVERFRVRGIESSAGLDPANPAAFVTGLTFAAAGQFTGTMTPITHPTATVVDHLHCYATAATRGTLCTVDAPVNAGAACVEEQDCGGTEGTTTYCIPDKFPKGLRVALTDALESGPRVFDVKKPVTLCAPASKNDESVLDEDTHIQAFQIALTKGRCVGSPANAGGGCSREADCGGVPSTTEFCVVQPKVPPARGIRVTNQFHSPDVPLVLDTNAPDRLLVPTAKSRTEPPDELGPHQIDHYKCYPVKLGNREPKFTPIAGVLVEDQFTNGPRAFDLAKPTRLCLPADKNGEGIKNESASLLCYQSKASKGVCAESSVTNAGLACTSEEQCGGTTRQTSFCALQPRFAKVSGVFLFNQLHASRVDVTKEGDFCIPSGTSANP